MVPLDQFADLVCRLIEIRETVQQFKPATSGV
jgi:hypothetical protein